MVQRSAFITLVNNRYEKRNASLFIKSLQAFGGEMRGSRVWLLEGNPAECSCADLANDQIRILSLSSSRSEKYPFLSKVSACAQAEDLLSKEVETMVWVNPECLVIQPPVLLQTKNPFLAAFRSVHIRNVGSPLSEPLDDFWRIIYETVDVAESDISVESLVDQQLIRPYYNTHVFSINPSLRVCRHWLELFKKLILDESFQNKYCLDDLHKIFLHQAVLSTVLLKEIGSQSIRILPPSYSYPWHLHSQIPAERQAARLNDLCMVVYENDCPINPKNSLLPIDEPFKSWLTARTI